MPHYFIGDLGHLCIIISFVAPLVSAFAYWKSQTVKNPEEVRNWINNARAFFYCHVGAIIGAFICLFIIIFNHYFEYHYAYSHSSRSLPIYYMISCFWEGQEGSFLLWIFWQGLLGIFLIHKQKTWEAPIMIVFASLQVFLASMILGVVIPFLHTKIGSSPFILLRETIHDPIFTLNPDFIPIDGSGLNPLLQNYWMVIHPPTLFLGFATTAVPFAFCIAGLWKKQYDKWIEQALPWALFASITLGLGIIMGGYWAYETLSFGGYWNWDPVENAVYVPWLILIASIHTMISYKSNKSSSKSSFILVVSVFLLILYSTFLTRSGILGDTSVHSFTDLGLSGQLLIYLLFFTVVSFALIIYRWREIPSTNKEISTYSGEFWIFIGATTLCLMGFQVLIPTSIPVYNSLVEFVTGNASKMAPPADQVIFYSKFQLWFGVAIALLSGTGHLFWWKKMNKKRIKKELLLPIIISLILFSLIISMIPIHKPAYLALIFAGVYTIVLNINVLKEIIQSTPNLSGGAVAHIGVGIMLIGILFSSGYSSVVSLNNTGMLISKELPVDFNRDNLLFFINEPKHLAGYEATFLGERFKLKKNGEYIKKYDVQLTSQPSKVIAKKEILYKGKKLYQLNDTFNIIPEDTYHEIELRKENKVVTTLFPRVQFNPDMGGFIASPDINRRLLSDIYTYVSLPMNREVSVEWSETDTLKLKLKEQFFVNDYIAVLENIYSVDHVPNVQLAENDIAIQASIRVEGERDTYYAKPTFLIRDQLQVGYIPYEVEDLGVKITLLNIHPETNQFSLGLNFRQKDWVVVKALEKPLINFLWLGTGLIMIGFFIAMIRRFKAAG